MILAILKPSQKSRSNRCLCSFNCCLAWIRDNKHDRRYDESEMLLQKIYSKSQHGLSDTALKPSPHGEH